MKTKRMEFPAAVKRQRLRRERGHCQKCGEYIEQGREYDHILPCALGGLPTLANCQLLCSPCHSIKTHHEDRPRINKANRLAKKNAGKTKSNKRKWASRPMAHGRGSRTKRKMDGTVVRR